MKSRFEMTVSSKSHRHHGGISRTGRPERTAVHEEMHALLDKLKELVPNMPRNKKLSTLEIIQYVIDYIVDLQVALETHPSSRPGANTSTAQSPRQPLGVLSPASNTVANTCAVQEVGNAAKPPQHQHLPELVSSTTRPVSC